MLRFVGKRDLTPTLGQFGKPFQYISAKFASFLWKLPNGHPRATQTLPWFSLRFESFGYTPGLSGSLEILEACGVGERCCWLYFRGMLRNYLHRLTESVFGCLWLVIGWLVSCFPLIPGEISGQSLRQFFGCWSPKVIHNYLAFYTSQIPEFFSNFCIFFLLQCSLRLLSKSSAVDPPSLFAASNGLRFETSGFRVMLHAGRAAIRLDPQTEGLRGGLEGRTRGKNWTYWCLVVGNEGMIHNH